MDLGTAGPKNPHTIWIALLIAGGVGCSLVFACATPFAAVATLASLKLDRREAAAAIGLVWLANQAIGYGILGYPWTLDSAGWGIAIGLSGYLALLAATALSPSGPARLAISLPFLGAFTTYELGLYIAGLVLSGGADAFAAAIVAQIFVVNLVALIGLLAIYRLALLFRLPRRELPAAMLPP